MTSEKLYWRSVGVAVRATSRGPIDIGTSSVCVRESFCGRFQMQRIREYDGRHKGRVRYHTYWKLFDGEKMIGTGSWLEMSRAATDAARRGEGQ